MSRFIFHGARIRFGTYIVLLIIAGYKMISLNTSDINNMATSDEPKRHIVHQKIGHQPRYFTDLPTDARKDRHVLKPMLEEQQPPVEAKRLPAGYAYKAVIPTADTNAPGLYFPFFYTKSILLIIFSKATFYLPCCWTMV